MPRKRAPAETSVVAWRPRAVFSDPAKEFETAVSELMPLAVTVLPEVRESNVLSEPEKELEPTLVELKMPLVTIFPEADAEVNSRTLNWVEAALKVQLPPMLWVAEREAGPLVQSSLTRAPAG